jgi:hypothetical protein
LKRREREQEQKRGYTYIHKPPLSFGHTHMSQREILLFFMSLPIALTIKLIITFIPEKTGKLQQTGEKDCER